MSRFISGAGRSVLALIAAVLAVTILGVTSSSAGASGTTTAAAQATKSGAVSAPISSRTADGWFRGQFVPQNFTVSDGQMVAHGVVTGVVHKKGTSPQQVSKSVAVPVTSVNGQSTSGMTSTAAKAAAAGATCDVLDLVLGPLDLNLLGLEVHLNQVVLHIVADPAGGLLGQLLCAVANLLNGGPLGGLLTQLADLLNQILGQLGLLTV